MARERSLRARAATSQLVGFVVELGGPRAVKPRGLLVCARCTKTRVLLWAPNHPPDLTSPRAARSSVTGAPRLHLALQKIAGCDAEYITERLQQLRVEIADASAAPHEAVQCGRADAAHRPLRECVRRDAVL